MIKSLFINQLSHFSPLGHSWCCCQVLEGPCCTLVGSLRTTKTDPKSQKLGMDRVQKLRILFLFFQSQYRPKNMSIYIRVTHIFTGCDNQRKTIKRLTQRVQIETRRKSRSRMWCSWRVSSVFMLFFLSGNSRVRVREDICVRKLL